MVGVQDLSKLGRRVASKAKSTLDDVLGDGEGPLAFTNLENDPRYAFELPQRRVTPGVSAMLRAKNEASNVPVVLPAILDLFDEVVFVDNGSTDETLARVIEVAQSHEHGDRIRVATYPFSVSRCGDEHWATPESSVRNLAYFYNWCLSQCSFSYVFKWDLDMVPMPGGDEALRKAFGAIDHDGAELWSVRCQTIYRSPEGRWFAANDEINREPRLHPNRATVRYHKARQWEALEPDIELTEQEVAAPCIYELKDTSVDEFDHWTDTDNLSPRKQVEYRNYCAVRDGEVADDRFTELSGDALPATLR